jgi:hypothetical protein
MPFRAEQRHRDEFERDGYTIFRSLLPPSLLADLRCAAADASRIARERHGDCAQRLQPIFDVPGIDPRPFRDFAELPELQEAIRAVLTPQHWHGSERLGLLVDPAVAFTTRWHRDAFLPERAERFQREAVDPALYNQCNCPLHPDRSLLIVPRSHLRPNTEAEVRHAGARQGHRITGAWADLLAYADAMPGAMRVELDAGDYALYRASMWHVGIYSPSIRRATLHDHVDTEASVAWRREMAAVVRG